MYKNKTWRKDMDYWLREDRQNRINANVVLSSVDVSKLSDEELVAHFNKVYEHVSVSIYGKIL